MLINFLNHTCNIVSKTSTNDNGIEKEVITPVYSNIPCHFYSISGGYRTSEIGVNTPQFKNKIIVGPDKANIRQGMYVDVSDPLTGLIGNFIVDLPPKVNRLITGIPDSIELTLTNR